ncbi:uncharacterized protein LOC131146231 [Malania oleifera]|uniref:uncharacterized protein LOC131146231 n=1 Tax=Malania oleifera TaxID=397392 RepID=UPI0025AE9DE5|nr:uncharacterized protein LOC131146231 [Malania oleifera]
MSDDSVKRFQSVMDKLFHAPKSKPNSPSTSGVQPSRGKKRANTASALAVVDSKLGGDALQAPLCRPWHRGDLMRRLATFKSMSWFAKPKVVGAVNCARRGWVNVEMDIIACETCGARLLFSTPSSWTQEQVEKAALVFSLKLDNGHKLLCPWIDNACDETLAQFPPTSVPILVDGYRQRSSGLLKLSALPLISSSAIDHMRSPQLEQFLAQSLASGCENGSAGTSATESLGNEKEAAPASLYYQAQKLISLCGWELRSLPYVVDGSESAKDANCCDLSHVVVTTGWNPSFRVYSSGPEKTMEENGEPMASRECQYDPNSVVLDCRFCGASVGLWAFSMVPRPVELLRLVGYAELNGENNSVQENASVSGAHETYELGNENLVASNISTLSKDKLLNLGLTIAGGPSPTKQNFRATISLPAIGRNLRARISSDSECRDGRLSYMTCNQEGERSNSESNNLLSEKENRENNVTGQAIQLENTRLLERNSSDDRLCCTRNDQSPLLKHTASDMGDGTNACQQRLAFPETGTQDSTVELQAQDTQNVMQDFGQNDKLPENEENVGMVNPDVVGAISSQVRDSSTATPESNANDRLSHENDSLMMAVADNCQHIPGTDSDGNFLSLTGHQESSCVESFKETNNTDLEKGEKIYDALKTSSVRTNDHNGNIGDKVQTPVNSDAVSAAAAITKDLKQIPFDRTLDFDPIRQHRHFCPWIATIGSTVPGWQQTFSALQQQKEFSHPSPTSSPSASTLKVDDPIASIRKLFVSPSTKRMKLAHGSS